MEINLKDVVYYDITSPTGLRWVQNIYRGQHKSIVAAIKDDQAGYLSTFKYYQIGIQGKVYFTHRIIWELINGPIQDGLSVDHIDGNPANNRIENLRLVSFTQNQRNKGKGKNNTSGFVGVSRMSSLSAKGVELAYWKACWSDLDGNQKTKQFSVRKLGENEAFIAACEARTSALLELNKLGAGYTERHIEGA